MLLVYLLLSLLCGSAYSVRKRGGPISQVNQPSPAYYSEPINPNVPQARHPLPQTHYYNIPARPNNLQVRPVVQDVPNRVQDDYNVRFTPHTRPQVVPQQPSSNFQGNQIQPDVYSNRERTIQASVPGSVPSRFKAKPSSQSQFVSDAVVGSILRNTPSGAQLLRTVPAISALIDRLPDNATLIRPNIVDTFSCEGRKYGYYADVDNECQIFHVCFPLHDLWPTLFTTATTYTFSFICPKYTRFSQDAMVCAWESEAVPCEESVSLYTQNEKFFVKIRDDEGKVRWANLGDKLPLNIVTEDAVQP